MRTLLLAACMGLCTLLAQAQPTNNPYLARYTQYPASHWTNALKWTAIHNVTTYGAVANDGQDDKAAIDQAIQAAGTTGGGVVYFPAGEYNVSDSLILLAGVILRGDNPAVANAKDAAFLPPSRLVFPQYVPDTTANGGAGTDNRTAFKVITCRYDAKNIGVVNLDINRAGIEFHPAFDSLGMVTHAGGTTANYQPLGDLRNVIVMGVRSNNVAQPNLNIPNLTGPNKMRPWQRWYNYFVANVDVYASENAAICNNRLNDAPTDNFVQPGYKVRNRCTNCSNYRNVGQPNNSTWNADNFVEVLDPVHAEFDYTAHYGITLNRDKKVMQNGRRTIKPMIWYPEPEQEPSLYAKGFIIEDNWVYKTNRVGIWCAGLGLVVKGNTIRDTAINGSTTWATPKKKWLGPNGDEVLRNFSATFENRGIDFGGSDLLIEDNDILVSAADFPESQYGSIDGEGIMDQGNGGGTNPNGLIVRRNRVASNRNDCTNPTIGIYRTMSAHNVLYEDNVFTGNAGCMQVEGDRGANEYSISNILVRNNTNLKHLIVTGGYGYNAVAHNNTSVPSLTANMRISCFVREYNNSTFSLVNGACRPGNPAAPDTSAFPRVKLEFPTALVTYTTAPAVITLKASIANAAADSIVFYRDAFERLGKGVLSLNSDSASLDWVPPTTDGVHKFYAKVYVSAPSFTGIFKTDFGTVVVDDGDATTNDPRNLVTSTPEVLSTWLQAYPNPTTGVVRFQTRNIEIKAVTATDLLGRSASLVSNLSAGEVSLENLPTGTYLLRVQSTDPVQPVRTLRVVKR